jgi:6-phosphogluconolactonase
MSTAALAETRTFVDAKALANAVADWLCGRAQASTGPFAISLAGGSTPRGLYQRLAAPDIAARFPWNRVHWFWGDERFVPPDHNDSNFRMVREALLSRVPVPAENIHPVPTEGITPEQAAASYEATLKSFYGGTTLAADRPLFAVTLLGVGAEGHTASLFPGQPALQEMRRWAVAVIGAKSEARITLTYPALDSSRDLAFVVTGAEKRPAVARAQAGDAALPAGRIRPVGQLHWFLDSAAAPERTG